MKHKYLSLILVLATILLCFACKDDDEQGSGNEPPVTFENSCCKVPPLQTCAGGVEIFLPNTFSPNGDGFNDILYLFSSTGLKEITSFTITNTNGAVIFEKTNFQANDYTNGWDGRLQDGNIVEDVYNYNIVLVNIKDETFSYTGQVCSRASSSPHPCVENEKNCIYPLQHDGEGGFFYNIDPGDTCN